VVVRAGWNRIKINMEDTMKKSVLTSVSLAALLLSGVAATAETLRIAEHQELRLEALRALEPALEAELGIDIEILEYPVPDRDYLTKLLTELRAGNAPDVFTAPRSQDLADMVAAGYLAPIGEAFEASDAYGELFDVAKDLVRTPEGEYFAIPALVDVQQIYYRRDLLEEAGISTEQPEDWADLLARAMEIKEETGAFGLMFPAGVTWGGGAFGEGFKHMILGTDTPQIANADGTLNLSGQGVQDVFGFYADLINNDLMPVDPLLGPEPWVIPKYEMFPAAELAATTCGTWCYIYDWGPQSRNPIPDVTEAVGTWAFPGQNGGNFVVVDVNAPWAVNASSLNVEMATKLAIAMASVDATVSYATRIGNIPARADATDNAEFMAMTPLVPIHANVEDGTFLNTTTGFSTVAEGVARATEALLRKETDAAGAQAILIEYVSDLLGEDVVK